MNPKDKPLTPKSKSTEPDGTELAQLASLFEQAQSAMQSQAARSVDVALVVRNWLFGWYIVEHENGSASRGELYGKALLKGLSKKLSKNGLKGMSLTNLKQFRQFYESYKEIGQTLSDSSLKLQPNQPHEKSSPTDKLEISQIASDQVMPPKLLEDIQKNLSFRFHLSWSHYVVLLSIKSSDERRFYEIESIENAWSIRELKRQMSSSLYERLALSRDKKKIKELAQKGQLINTPQDVLKSPYVLEFLGLEGRASYSEHELESAIISKLEHFLLELGKGFLFEARQKRFTFDDDHFYVDLVFYNRLLRCYVIIDLKRDKLTHQDLGQMQMYVNYFDRYVKLDHEAPTVGILLCHRKHDDLVELTLPQDSNIHASEYQLYLPSKEELKKQLEEAQLHWEEAHGEE